MNYVLKMVLGILLIAALLSPVYAGIDDYPRSDEMLSIVCANETITVSKANAGEIDTAFDVRSPANVKTLQDAGWTVTALLGFGFHYIGINCRDVAPVSSGDNYVWNNRTAGDPLFPLNVSQFRFALHLIVAPYKQQIISEVFDWTSIKIDTCPTPAAGSAWMNPPTFPPDPWASALSLLNSAGFYNTTAQTGLADGIWANTNPAIGPLGEIRAGFGTTNPAWEKQIRVLTCPEAALSTSLVTVKFREKWNLFFGKNSDGNDYFARDDIPWATAMIPVFSWDHDADMWGAGWTVGRDPDYLYDFFHTLNDIPYGYNHPGISDPTLDTMLEGLKYTINKTTGEIITDIAQLQALCKEAQTQIFYLAPYIVNRAAVTPNLFAEHQGVKGWINSLGYTANNGYTYDFIYKTGTNTIRQCNQGTITTLNTLVAGSVYDWNVLNRVYDSLMNVDPFTKDDRMWGASSYTLKEWKDTANNIHGLNITFKIRDGIQWQDGQEYNASSAKWSWDFTNATQPPRYQDTWQFYMGSEVIDRLTVRIYLNITGVWYLYSVAGTAMLWHKAIWEPWWGNFAEGKSWEPWKVKYDDWTGQTGHGDLTCIVATGSWVFVEYDQVAQVCRLMANRPFTLGTWQYPVRYWASHFLREDLDFSGKVNILDISTCGLAFAATPGHPRWRDGQCDIDNSAKVDILDLAKIAKKFNTVTLPA